ncbi:MAG: hypothetical protein KC583_23920, partial [Myxococcales bacterium]|nr:hypothetical protein [Myxococcales bacterium]
QLQNCQTDEFVSVHALAADTRALWIIGSAGWCSACRQYLPQVFNLMNTIEPTQARLMIVVGEDGAYAQPTTGFCRRYAEHYGLPDASNFYIDHNGVSSFSTLFTYLNLYSNDGAFGLPWNAVVSGGDAPVYEYSDGSGQAQTLVDVLREVAGLPIQ